MRTTVLATALLNLHFSGAALACSCAPPESPRQEAARSVNTFAGTVISIATIAPPPARRVGLFEPFFNDIRSLLTGRTIRPPERFEPYQIVTFQVSRTFHGAPAAVRRISTGPVDSTCSSRFDQGKTYVVYAFEWQGRLIAGGACSRTGVSSDPRVGYQALVDGI
ncbi:hypothetical protein ACFQZQ_12700 [Lysobacter koreensis]|uniref:Uncharacterized protein n=1 Tax=Lysobacter koreensis TaxID=266122 RepID=A0ABW2YPH8_9GAMM